MTRPSPCPNCGSQSLYQSDEVDAGSGSSPNYLPGLGGTFKNEKFRLVICKNCGLTRFFARRSALEKLSDSKKWKRI
jgi:predicted nucleic-acid-binding Zn-ribbon protein